MFWLWLNLIIVAPHVIDQAPWQQGSQLPCQPMAATSKRLCQPVAASRKGKGLLLGKEVLATTAYVMTTRIRITVQKKRSIHGVQPLTQSHSQCQTVTLPQNLGEDVEADHIVNKSILRRRLHHHAGEAAF